MKYKFVGNGPEWFGIIHAAYLSTALLAFAYLHYVEELFPAHAYTLDSLFGLAVFYTLWPGLPSLLILLLSLEKKDVRT